MAVSGTDPYSRGAGAATDGTLRVVQASDSPLAAGAATEAKQDTGNTTLASILAKIIAAPATEATAAAILAKIIAAPATEAKQDTGNTSLASLDTKLPAKGTALVAASTPVNIASDQIVPTTRTKVGAQGNAWNAAAVLAAGVSTAVDTGSLHRVAAFGNADAATTITVQVSENNVTFYDTTTTAVLGGASDFHVAFDTAARYVRLKSSGAATITATIAAKG